jgi:phosphate:Na+ symporter
MALESVMLIVAGLILFLYALNHLSDALKTVAGEKMQRVLMRFTGTLFTSILTGVAVTILLDSSSAVIIMTIALVNARIMGFRQAMGVVMGANIGTAVSSQIIAMNLGAYAAVPISLGFLLMVLPRKQILREIGKVIFSFGLIFFGLFTIERGVIPLRNAEYFLQLMKSLDNPVKGMFTGALVTLIIQSSSATMGMVIGLASKGLISLAGGIAVMLGAELGTCSDTLLATIGRNRSAVKTGFFHLLFNICSIMLGIVFLALFTSIVLFISGDVSISRQIANAHILFNVLGVVLLIPFLGLFERALDKLFPETKKTTLAEVKSRVA